MLLLVAGPLLPACAPEIGDSCGNALDCSASGTRLCDDTQPGGYCTLGGCEEDTCPPESICVKFGKILNGVPVDRLASTYCMYKCDSDSDCRNGDGYSCFYAACRHPDDEGKCPEEPVFGAGSSGSTEAKILGPASQKFCAAIPMKVDTSKLDAGRLDAGKPDEEDAGMSMPEPDTAMMSMPEDSSGN